MEGSVRYVPCAECKRVLFKQTSPSMLYCSDACQTAGMTTRCGYCQATAFVKRAADHKYCSEACRYAAKKQRQGKTIQ